ncbi:hypothetical protein BJX63DRAFT_311377 [Aspergillus granulosus]|uniref:Uncharacterized protein n=1 Tax=Aspergillus granulosus TaxID=176169 RepID=A0ABR4I0A8_9EURO
MKEEERKEERRMVALWLYRRGTRKKLRSWMAVNLAQREDDKYEVLRDRAAMRQLELRFVLHEILGEFSLPNWRCPDYKWSRWSRRPGDLPWQRLNRCRSPRGAAPTGYSYQQDTSQAIRLCHSDTVVQFLFSNQFEPLPRLSFIHGSTVERWNPATECSCLAWCSGGVRLRQAELKVVR